MVYQYSGQSLVVPVGAANHGDHSTCLPTLGTRITAFAGRYGVSRMTSSEGVSMSLLAYDFLHTCLPGTPYHTDICCFPEICIKSQSRPPKTSKKKKTKRRRNVLDGRRADAG